MTTLEKMQANFPHIYNVYDERTVLYNLLSVFADRHQSHTNIINRLNSMISIDTTADEDLEYRWGSLLHVAKDPDESYLNYRSRLRVIYSSLNGGTADTIKFAVASAIGIGADAELTNNVVKVYDAWDYDQSYEYGRFIVVIDVSFLDESYEVNYDRISSLIDSSKASGIMYNIIILYVTLPDMNMYLNTEFVGTATVDSAVANRY